MSEEWIRTQRETGVLPVTKLGTAHNSPILFDVDDLDALMEHYHRPATRGPLAEREAG
jgi:hypothetical protein